MNLLEKTLKALNKVNLDDLKVFDLENKNPFYNLVVIATGNIRQANALVGYLKQELKNVYQIKGIEGKRSGWLLVDLGELLIHIFDADTRAYYKFDERFIGIKQISLT